MDQWLEAWLNNETQRISHTTSPKQLQRLHQIKECLTSSGEQNETLRNVILNQTYTTQLKPGPGKCTNTRDKYIQLFILLFYRNQLFVSKFMFLPYLFLPRKC